MPFSITGDGRFGPQKETRAIASSAIVLAMKWAAHGVANVMIAPPGQAARCFEVFRIEHYGIAQAGSGRRRARPWLH